jgi:hypothetical protein
MKRAMMISLTHDYDCLASSLSASGQAPGSRTQFLWQAGLTIEKQIINR